MEFYNKDTTDDLELFIELIHTSAQDDSWNLYSRKK